MSKIFVKQFLKLCFCSSMTEKKLDDEPYWYLTPRPKDQPVIVGEFPPKTDNDTEDDNDSYGAYAHGKGKALHRSDSKSSGSKKKKKKDKSKEPSLTKLKK